MKLQTQIDLVNLLKEIDTNNDEIKEDMDSICNLMKDINRVRNIIGGKFIDILTIISKEEIT